MPPEAAQNTARCVECGRTFPKSEMVAFEEARVCVPCKPRFFQKLREGIPVSPEGTGRRQSLRFAAGRSRWSRTPGEKAFDRCFFPWVFSGIYSAMLFHGVHAWGLFAVGVISAAFWVGGLISLIAGWRDPAARLLRLCALWFLLGLGISTLALLSAPVR